MILWQNSRLSDLTSEWEGEHVCAAGTAKMGCNFKINSEYLLGATFAFDTLSCVPSQFAGTAWVCHSFLSQQSRSVGIRRSHCLCFGEINKMILTIIIFFVVTAVGWGRGGGGGGVIPTAINNNDNDNARCKEFRPFTVSHWKSCRAPNTGPTSTRGFGVCVQKGFPQRSHGFYSVSINHLHLEP